MAITKDTSHIELVQLVDDSGVAVSTSGATVKSTAAAPTYVEGVATNPISSDLHGSERVTILDASGVAVDFTAVSPVKIDQTTDGVTNAVHLVAGTAKVGVVTTDQTTHGTTDLVAADQTKVGGTTILTGNGVTGAGSQRVTIASDNSAISVAAASLGFDVSTTITRPANTTAYTAVDALGGALDLGILGTSAATVMINSVQLEADITAIPAGQTSWNLYLYSVTPPSATADNGAWDLPAGDRASFLGSIAIPTMVDLGSTLYVEVNNIGKQVKLAGTHLFGYLVTVGGFTPAANSEVYKLTVHTMVI